MYSRRRSRGKSKATFSRTKSRYSNETFSGNYIMLGNSGGQPSAEPLVVDSIASLGARKAKNFTLDIVAGSCYLSNDTGTELSTKIPDSICPVYFALVYLPDGLSKTGQDLAIGAGATTSLIEPNQNVIMQGVLYPGQPQRVFTKLGRILDSGDKIVLLLKARYSQPTGFICQNVAFTVDLDIKLLA